jgi:tetratricopeptide (TPR) repeat protein
VQALYRLGYIACEQQRYNDAITYLTRLTELEQKHAKGYFCLGKAYNALEKWDEAIESLKNAISLNPGFEFAWYQLSLSYSGKKQFNKAIETLEKVAGINPKLEYVYDQMGRIYLKTGKTGEAVEMHKKAVETAPKLAYLWKNLGVAYLRNRMYWEAVASLNKSLDINKSNGTAHYYLGCSYKNLGEDKLCIKHLKETLRLLPNHQKARSMLESFGEHVEPAENKEQDKLFEKLEILRDKWKENTP